MSGATTERFLWPRLSPGRTVERRAHVAGLDAAAARAASALDDAGAAPAPSGGRPVPSTRVADVQAGLRLLAGSHGWPAPPSAREAADELAAFDRQAAVALHRDMAILPADAAHEGVWHFVALVLAPDVARWRRPDGEPSTGGPLRHVFARLWWRARVFGSDLIDPPAARPLSEVELGHLLGRPALVADHDVARSVAAAVLAIDAPRRDRDALTGRLAEGMLRRAPIVCFEALTRQQLDDEVNRVVATVR